MSCRKHREMHYFLSANRKEQKSVIHKIRFINSVIFMASPLSSLTDHLAKCLCKVNCKGCKWSLEYMNKEWFTNIQLFGQEHNIEKFWWRFTQKISKYIQIFWWRPEQITNFFSCRGKVFIHIHIHGWLAEIQWNIITHKKEILQQSDTGEHHKYWPVKVWEEWEDFELQNLGQYYDHLYVQSDTLLLTDIFGSFRKKCLKISEVDPVHFFHVGLKLLTDTDMLLMLEKGIRVGICHAICRYSKASSNA